MDLGIAKVDVMALLTVELMEGQGGEGRQARHKHHLKQQKYKSGPGQRINGCTMQWCIQKGAAGASTCYDWKLYLKVLDGFDPVSRLGFSVLNDYSVKYNQGSG